MSTSSMEDYVMDVVLAKVEDHLREYDDGRLAEVASTFHESSEERLLLDNLVGSIRILRDLTRISLAQESLKVKAEDPDNRNNDIMAEVMFHILANSYLDARSREYVYQILFKALFGTKDPRAEPVTFCTPESTKSEEDKYLQVLAEDAAKDKWLRMLDEEAVYDGPEHRSRERLLTEFTQYAETLAHYVTTDEPMEDMDRQSMRWAIKGLRYSAQYFKDNPDGNPLEQGEQPIVLDDDGVIRFRENRIIRLLLDGGPFDLNQIALMAFSDQERQQLAQLIGYSVSGYGDLPYAEGEPIARADRAVDIFITEQEAGS